MLAGLGREQAGAPKALNIRACTAPVKRCVTAADGLERNIRGASGGHSGVTSGGEHRYSPGGTPGIPKTGTGPRPAARRGRAHHHCGRPEPPSLRIGRWRSGTSGSTVQPSIRRGQSSRPRRPRPSNSTRHGYSSGGPGCSPGRAVTRRNLAVATCSDHRRHRKVDGCHIPRRGVCDGCRRRGSGPRSSSERHLPGVAS